MIGDRLATAAPGRSDGTDARMRDTEASLDAPDESLKGQSQVHTRRSFCGRNNSLPMASRRRILRAHRRVKRRAHRERASRNATAAPKAREASAKRLATASAFLASARWFTA